MKTWKFANGWCAKRSGYTVAWAKTREGAIAKANRLKKPSKSPILKKAATASPLKTKPKSKKKGNFMAKKKSRKGGGKRYIVPGLITGSGKVKISGAIIYGTAIGSLLATQGMPGWGASKISNVSPLTMMKTEGMGMSEGVKWWMNNFSAVLPYFAGGIALAAIGGRFNQRLGNSPVIL